MTFLKFSCNAISYKFLLLKCGINWTSQKNVHDILILGLKTDTALFINIALCSLSQATENFFDSINF